MRRGDFQKYAATEHARQLHRHATVTGGCRGRGDVGDDPSGIPAGLINAFYVDGSEESGRSTELGVRCRGDVIAVRVQNGLLQPLLVPPPRNIKHNVRLLIRTENVCVLFVNNTTLLPAASTHHRAHKQKNYHIQKDKSQGQQQQPRVRVDVASEHGAESNHQLIQEMQLRPIFHCQIHEMEQEIYREQQDQQGAEKSVVFEDQIDNQHAQDDRDCDDRELGGKL